MIQIKGISKKFILPKEEVINLLSGEKVINKLRFYSWDFGELKDMKYNSDPRAKKYFDTIIEKVDFYAETVMQGLYEAGVPIDKLKLFLNKSEYPEHKLKCLHFLLEKYGYNKFISKVYVPYKGNKKLLSFFMEEYENFGDFMKGALLKVKNPKAAIDVASKFLTLTERSEYITRFDLDKYGRFKLTSLPAFCEVLGKGDFFTSKQHEKAAARFLFDDINFLKYYDINSTRGADFIPNKNLKYSSYDSFFENKSNIGGNISQYWEFGLKPLLEKGTLSRKRLLELLDVRLGPGESETKTKWLNHLIFFEAITPEQVNLYQNMKRK